MKEVSFVCIQPSDRRASEPTTPGTRYWRICDEQTPTDSLFVGIVEVPAGGTRIPLHYHSSVEEFQYILSGTGVVWDAQGNEYPLSPGTCVYCPPQPKNAHGFKNTGTSPLLILCVFSSVGGKAPEQVVVTD